MWAWLKSIFSSEEKEKKQAEEEAKKKKEKAEKEEKEKKQAEDESKEILKQIQNKIESNTYSDFKQIYVVVVGRAGAGKSTLINSIRSAAQNASIKPSPTGQAESITKNTLLYNLMLENCIQLPIDLIDCRGLQSKVTADSLNQVISSDRELLKPNKTQEVSETNDKDVFFDILDPRTASIAILVFSANWVQNYHSDANRETLREMLQTKTKLMESGIPSFVILTKIDEVDKSVKDKILDFDSEKITELTTELGNLMKIDSEDIYPVWNITGRSFNVKQRCHILRLFKDIVLNGLEHARQCKHMKAAKKQEKAQRLEETKSTNPQN